MYWILYWKWKPEWLLGAKWFKCLDFSPWLPHGDWLGAATLQRQERDPNLTWQAQEKLGVQISKYSFSWLYVTIPLFYSQKNCSQTTILSQELSVFKSLKVTLKKKSTVCSKLIMITQVSIPILMLTTSSKFLVIVMETLPPLVSSLTPHVSKITTCLKESSMEWTISLKLRPKSEIQIYS